MNNNKKISICIPVFNGSDFLLKTIASILNQSYRNIEIIIVDDKSTDNSVEIISTIQNKNPGRIKLIKNNVNMGLMKTNNIALNEATGSWLLYIGQDDLLQVDHLAKMAKHFKESTSLIWCRHVTINEIGQATSKPKSAAIEWLTNLFIKFLLKRNNYIPSVGLLINKKKLEQVGGWPEKFKNYGEWYTWIRLAKIGKIKFCKKTIAFYRRHSKNITNSFTEVNTKKELKIYFDYCKETAKEIKL